MSLGDQFEERETITKIILVGEPSVGKTSIRKNYMGQGFNSNYLATIGADFSFATFENRKFSIWDIAGEQNYGSIRSQFYSGASGVIVVFDITRAESFHKIDHWIAEIKSTLLDTIPFILVGNKDDLRGITTDLIPNSEISRQIAKWEKLLDIKIPLFYTSALTGMNIQLIFKELLAMILPESTSP